MINKQVLNKGNSKTFIGKIPTGGKTEPISTDGFNAA